MADLPCPCFFAATHKLELGGMLHALPVYRCRLTEEMLERLNALAPYADVASCFAVGEPIGGQPVLCGPDMGPVAPRLCRRERLTGECRPAYSDLLAEWGGDPTPPEPLGVTAGRR